MHFDGAIFDMDGVITKTAGVHFSAWKKTFDDYLGGKSGDVAAFSHADYLATVDGRPRYEGVAAFLRSRGLDIPFGTPQDGPQCETVCGIGNRKDRAFNALVEQEGVETFSSTMALVEDLLRMGIKVGVATSSKNGARILAKAGVSGLFATHIDGTVAAERGLKGKPEPDIFLAAAKALGVTARRSMIVEDSVAGVEAGARGGFGLVIGIAREGHADDLRFKGADVAVGDLGEITVAEIDGLFARKSANALRPHQSDMFTP